MKLSLNRRQILKTAGAGFLGTMMPGGLLKAQSAGGGAEKSALVIIHLQGGYNALFSSAASFVNKSFGVTDANILSLSNGLVVDRSFEVLPAFALEHMATIGISHGIANHGGARDAHYAFNNRNAPLMLAAAMGGEGSILAAKAGASNFYGPNTAEGKVSFQTVQDMASALEGLGGGNSGNLPDRKLVVQGLEGVKRISQARFASNASALKEQMEGLDAALVTLTKEPAPLDLNAITQAYGLRNTRVQGRNLASQLAAAELMIRSGTNVVAIPETQNWDTHGDRDGARARQLMGTVLPSLKIFLERMLVLEGYNVVVMLTGEFARSLPGSDHATVTASTVIGKYITQGSTGQVDDRVRLPRNSPGIPALWGFLAAALKAPQSAIDQFGGNPHGLIV